MERLIRLVMVSMLILFHGCGVGRQAHFNDPCLTVGSADSVARIACYERALETADEDLRATFELALKKERYGASMRSLEQGLFLLQKNEFDGAMAAFETSGAIFPGNTKALQLLHETRNRKKSLSLTEAARHLMENNHSPASFHKAEMLLNEAFSLYPENDAVHDLMGRLKREKKTSSEYDIAVSSDQPFSLRFKETSITDVFEIISRLTDLNFVFDKDVRENSVTMFVKDVRVSDFLEMLLKTNNLAAKQADQKTLLIYPDTPQKEKEYQDLQVKTFYLSHLKAKDFLAVISKVLKLKDIIANEATNTLTIRDTEKAIQVASRLIKANDLPSFEVVLNVELLEVRTSLEEELGLTFSDSVTFGVSETSSGIDSDSNFRIAGYGSLNDLGSLSSRELYLSIPTANLNLLKQDGDTRILARPTVRVSDKEKATILIGERIPLRSNRRTESDGTVTYDYQYQDVGIKLVATPEVSRNGEIRLTLNFELSSLGNNVGTVDDPQYAINTRTTSTVLNVLDRDTVIIGGLTERADRSTIKKVPLLSELPILSHLFTNNREEDSNTDLLITIRPMIISGVATPSDGDATFWSGNWQRIHTTPPFTDQPHPTAPSQ